MAPEICPMSISRFLHYQDSVTTLLAHVPGIHQTLHPGDRIADLAGWEALQQRFSAFRQQCGQPVLVATLYGPTGAGKSTLFRLLTGIDVPAGDDVRPVSYSCVIAAPPERVHQLTAIFPGMRLELLTDVGRLRNGNLGGLYYVPFEANGGDGLPLVLADVPDFNSIEHANWAEAERMLQRAVVVLFIVYREAYADARVLEELARCCRLASSMVFVLTMTESRGQANSIWVDLLQKKLAPGGCQAAPAFQQSRADGRTLREFLAECPVYHSPRRERPSLDDIQPLRDDQPHLVSWLCGLDGENLLLRGLLEPVGQVIESTRELLRRVEALAGELQHNLQVVAERIAEASCRVAGSEFPVGRMIEVIFEETRRRQHILARLATLPMRLLSRPIRRVVDSGSQFASWLRGRSQQDAQVLNRQELERARLTEATEHLLNEWRSFFPNETLKAGLLTQANCHRAREAFQQIQVPEPADDWEEHLHQSVARWATEHPWLCNLLPVMRDVMFIGGLGLLVADLLTTGGLFGPALVGTLGVAGAAAAGSAAASALLKWAEDWKLNRVLQAADHEWQQQRSRELNQHLDHLQHLVFQLWFDQLEKLQRSPVEPCRQACNELDGLIQSVRSGT